jgi:hypothetical protein
LIIQSVSDRARTEIVNTPRNSDQRYISLSSLLMMSLQRYYRTPRGEEVLIGGNLLDERQTWLGACYRDAVQLFNDTAAYNAVRVVVVVVVVVVLAPANCWLVV